METPKCPFCAEEIAVDARKCKHCGEYLDPELKREREESGSGDGKGKKPWLIVAWLLVVLLIIIIAGALGC